MMKNTPNTKTIGISCNDPIVIDSSDEELDASHEIVLQRAKVPRKENKKSSSKQEKAQSEKHIDPEQSQWLKEKKEKNLIGVRRKMGKYVSEIKDPTDKKRYWLGTFKTPEEASMAYLAKKAEFNEKVNKAKQKTVSEKLSENETSDLLGKNKVAGNEGKIGFLNGVQIVDNDGFFVGELSQLDDLSIGCTEDGVFIPDMNFKQK